jgi:hypothetical protein
MEIEFVPKIIRWGRKFGVENNKQGRFIKAYQKGCGKSNSNPYNKRWQGKTYHNAKQDRVSKRGAETFRSISKRV